MILVFVVPAILDGKEPLLVAVVGAMAVMLVTITLAHGRGPKSLAAILGTALSLMLTVALAVIFTDLAHLTGLATEEAGFLQSTGAHIDVEGLLLAGMVIGALGVLDDVTISQSSTVLALRRANPALRFRELFGLAMRVGQDHVSATVNTLVLAYVGASLPVLLIFSSGQLGFFDAANVELVAKEIVATLVGSIGLIAAVPITTALATLLSGEIPAEELDRRAYSLIPTGTVGFCYLAAPMAFSTKKVGIVGLRISSLLAVLAAAAFAASGLRRIVRQRQRR